MLGLLMKPLVARARTLWMPSHRPSRPAPHRVLRQRTDAAARAVRNSLGMIAGSVGLVAVLPVGVPQPETFRAPCAIRHEFVTKCCRSGDGARPDRDASLATASFSSGYGQWALSATRDGPNQRLCLANLSSVIS